MKKIGRERKSPETYFFHLFFLISSETMTKTSSEVQQQGDRIIKTTTTEGEGREWRKK
jgi:hypothetical protein